LGLHSQFSSFGPAVNMAKRWLYSQLLDHYLWPEECTELIMAYLYMQNSEVTPPVQPQTGFLRFLHYLATTDFITEMVVVNFNQSMEEEELKNIDIRFTSNRSSFPPLCILTSCDFGKPSVWTQTAPSAEILQFVTNLAEAAVDLVSSDLNILCPKKIKLIFTPSLDGYNLIIHLKKSVLVPSQLLPVEKFTKLKSTFSEGKLQAVDFDVANYYLEEIRGMFDEFAIFFYDPCEGTKIAVLWKPKAFEPKPFKIKYVSGRKKEGTKLVVDLEAIIDDFSLLGEGLVENIEILSDKVLS